MGKPLSQAYGEINGMKDRTLALIDIAPKALAPQSFPEANGIQKRIVKEPVGVVLSIAPWNYPLLTSVNSSTWRRCGGPRLWRHDAVMLSAEGYHPCPCD